MTYQYFLTERPPYRDAYPHNANLIATNTFGMKTFVKRINQEAYGTVFYTAPLTKDQIKAYGLVYGGNW